VKADTHPRPPRQTARQKRMDDYASQWKENREGAEEREASRRLAMARALEWAESQRRARDQKQPTDQVSDRPIRGAELVRAIEIMRDSTGDPRFDVFLDLVIRYGFDREFQQTANRLQCELFGDPDDGYLRQVTFLHEVGKLEPPKVDGEPSRRRKLGILEACECVVAESGMRAPHSSTFEAAVDHLRKVYYDKRSSTAVADPERVG
jgi:hypothetical protein